ncbi:hypothetical protein P154DRAFT_620872 [Amniculicola lignicola CBS 123094]|uniref:Mucin-like protein n=1 Tax=Amniculicola lignicola CBS 123094 TaxID=1392246 RepID=A0A6A5WC39_9PLEO|nr:hypothetical protein P154DRAFT_620872 [Amniculicola lignicola CBS 123094]
MRSKRAEDAFSRADFDSLPISVQRKYFSELERLRIAEQATHEDPHRPPRRRRRSHTPSSGLSRSLTLGSTRRKLRKIESLRQEHALSQADARFFLSLPPKLQRQYFSREDQVVLVGRYEGAAPSPTDEHRAQQRLDDFQFDFVDDARRTASSEPERGRPRRRSRSRSPSPSPSISPFRTASPRTAQQTDCPTASTIMSPPSSHQPVPPALTFRRTLSLTGMSFRHSTSSAPVDPPATALGPSSWHQRAHSLSQSGRRSSHTPTAPMFDPEATHYRDPEARKKLRMFLASPQKFDEAVEFGFPSTSGDDNMAPRYQLPAITTDARNFSRDMQTFLRDDKVSFLEDDEEDKHHVSDGESVTDVESPITPSSIGLSFGGHPRHESPSNFSSLDSPGVPTVFPIQGRLNREMTLRMTLTRPDLRAEEDQLYGWQGSRASKDDPFALEELHLSDDMTGTKGAFYVKPKPSGNLVTRLFKRASRKGR